MEHDVEPEGEGYDEEGVPDQEQEEGLQHFVEHRDVHVIPEPDNTMINRNCVFPQLTTSSQPLACMTFFGYTILNCKCGCDLERRGCLATRMMSSVQERRMQTAAMWR